MAASRDSQTLKLEHRTTNDTVCSLRTILEFNMIIVVLTPVGSWPADIKASLLPHPTDDHLSADPGFSHDSTRRKWHSTLDAEISEQGHAKPSYLNKRIRTRVESESQCTRFGE
ncbi:hypothetical protein P154DRAFT_580480 [Amniculicola lignicola CBS 123094]|uniref:Uncharacterized protein n=1 Tax=Amniculicola lignicola CBS 123094 TaxID=1392246 RepID=A0A6A5W221_9PLEO|nr:hypothetical protein P154DRAFT_580480 [Amniculicola lignicola CBS 123094]